MLYLFQNSVAPMRHTYIVILIYGCINIIRGKFKQLPYFEII